MAQLQSTAAGRLFACSSSHCLCWSRPFGAPSARPLHRRCRHSLRLPKRQRLVEYKCLVPASVGRQTSSSSTRNGSSCRSSYTMRSNHRSNVLISSSNSSCSMPSSNRHITNSTNNNDRPFSEDSSSCCYGSIRSLEEHCLPRVSRDITACKWLRADIRQPQKNVRVISAASTSSLKQGPQRKVDQLRGERQETSSFSSVNGHSGSAGSASPEAGLLSAPAAPTRQTGGPTSSVKKSAEAASTVAALEDIHKENGWCGSEKTAATRAGSIPAMRFEEWSSCVPLCIPRKSDGLSFSRSDSSCKSTTSSPDNKFSETDTHICSSATDSRSHTCRAAGRTASAGGMDTRRGSTTGTCGTTDLTCDSSISCCIGSNTNNAADRKQVTFSLVNSCDSCDRTTENTRRRTTGRGAPSEEQMRSGSDLNRHRGPPDKTVSERITLRCLPAIAAVPFVAVEAQESPTASPAAPVLAAPAVSTAAIKKKAATGSVPPSALSLEVLTAAAAAATYDQPTDAGVPPAAGQQQRAGETFAFSGKPTKAATEKRNKQAYFPPTGKPTENVDAKLTLHADLAASCRTACRPQQPSPPVRTTAAEKAEQREHSSDTGCDERSVSAKPQNAAGTCGKKEFCTAVDGARMPLYSGAGAVGLEDIARYPTEVSELEGEGEFEWNEGVEGEAECDTAEEGEKQMVHCWGEKERSAAAGGSEEDYTAAYMQYMACMPLSGEEEDKIKCMWQRLLRDDWLCRHLQQRWGFPFALLRHSQLQRCCLRYFKQQVRERQMRPFAADTRVDKHITENRRTCRITKSTLFPSTESSRSSAGLCGPSVGALRASRAAEGWPKNAETAAGTAKSAGTTAAPASAAAAAAGGVATVVGARGVSAASPAETGKSVARDAAAEATAISEAPACKDAAQDAVGPREKEAERQKKTQCSRGCTRLSLERTKTMLSPTGKVVGGAAVAGAADLSGFIRQRQCVAWRQDGAKDDRRTRTLLFILKHLRAAAAGRATALPVALAEAVDQCAPPQNSSASGSRTSITLGVNELFKNNEEKGSCGTCVGRTAAEDATAAVVFPPEESPSNAGAAVAHWPTYRHSTRHHTGGTTDDVAAWIAAPREDAAAHTALASKKTASEAGAGGVQRSAAEDFTCSPLNREASRLTSAAGAGGGGGVCSDTYHTLLQLERGDAANTECVDDDAVAGGVNAVAAAAAAKPPSCSSVSRSLPVGEPGCLRPSLWASTEAAASHLTSSRMHLAEAAPLLCLVRWFLAEQHADHVLQYLNLARLADLRSPAAWYPAARAVDRDVTLHAGPPNSGKTAAAVQHLLRAATGCYLAPLRLLAWEVYEQLKQRGVKVSLITGQERRICKVDQQPVEDLDALCTGDCLVCFTRADVLKLRKRLSERGFDVYTIYGQLPPAVKQRQADLFNAAVQQAYLERCGAATDCSTGTPRDESVVITEKPTAAAFATPAAAATSAVVGTSVGATGTSGAAAAASLAAAAAFSSSAQVATGASAAGKGPLRVHRRAVLVATDAIGLGLNLHIRRVVFYRLQKYAGSSDGAARLLTAAEIRQLAGRAGRRSGVWGETGGLVSCMEGEDFERVKRAIEGDAHAECLERAALVPSLPQLIAFCEELERQGTRGDTAATGRQKDLQRVLASLAAAQDTEAEQQETSGNARAEDVPWDRDSTGVRRKNGLAGAAGYLASERDAAQRSAGTDAAASAPWRSCDAAARSAYAGSDPGTAAARRSTGGARAGGADAAAAQGSSDGGAAAPDGVHVVHAPSSSWHRVSFSYAEAVRCYIDLLQVDPPYFVPPHKLNLMLTVVHALADVPLPRQQLFTFCLAPLPFSSPYPFLKHTQKGEQQSQDKQQQRQRSGGPHGGGHVHALQHEAAEQEKKSGALETTNDTGHVPGSDTAAATRLATRGASKSTTTPPVSPPSPPGTGAREYGGNAGEEESGREETAEEADPLCVGGGGPLPAAALAAAGLSLLLLNALRTFAVLLATCGHVPLPPHVFTSASGVAAGSASGAATTGLRRAPNLLQPQEEPILLEQRSPAEEQHGRHVGHPGQQQNQQHALRESSKPAAAAVDLIRWCNVSHGATRAAEQTPHFEVRAARQPTADEEMTVRVDTSRSGDVADVRIIAYSREAAGAEGHPAAEARQNFLSAKHAALTLRDKVYGESGETVEAGEAFTTESEAEEEEKRYAERLLLLEENYQIVDLYVWLARKFPAAFVDVPIALQVQRMLTNAIDAHLRGT